MRVIRTLMLVVAAAVAVGGCAQTPIVRYQMAAAPQGIDNVVYGGSPGYAAAQPSYAAAPSYGVAAAPSYGAAAAPPYDASGQIALPLIGPVAARGLTTDQLAARIGDMLRQGYVREPHVAVEVEAYRPFFILGEVAAPGQYPYSPNMTAETAVAIAGGFGPRGLHSPVVISRNFNGQQFRFEAPLTAPIQPGDTVRINERWF